MFILDSKLAINNIRVVEFTVENCIFTNFLMGATIQDSSIREKSNVRVINNKLYFIFIFCFIFCFYFSFYLRLGFNKTSWSHCHMTQSQL